MHERHKLNNGLRVIYQHIPYVKSISIGVYIKSGSRFENKDNNGVSHFIEHMLFKGTKKRNSQQISDEIESLGGQLNAFTARESTCYYVKVLDSHFEKGLDILSDMILNSNFSKNEIEKEKAVVIEEIKMYEDMPEDLVTDIQFEALLGENPLSYPILGTEQTVGSFTRESILEYFNQKYVPGNAVIAVVGNFDKKVLIDTIEEKFSKWTDTFDLEKLNEESPKLYNKFRVKNKPIEQVHIALTLKGLESGHKDVYTLLAINNYFGSGTSSKLFQSVREDKGYVYAIHSFPSSYKNAGIFTIYFACNPSYVEDSIRIINQEIKDIYINKISDELIDKLKEQLKGNYILGLEGVSSMMFGIGKAELILKRVRTQEEILKRIDAITKDDINRVIEYIFEEGVISASAVGSDITEEDLIKYIRD